MAKARVWSRSVMRAAVLVAAIVVGLAGAAPAAAMLAPDPCVRVESTTLPSCPAANGLRGGVDETVLHVPSPPAAGYGAPQRSDLPTTGPDVGGLLTIGAAMVLAGVVLVTVRRRGVTSTLAPAPSDADFAWHAPTVELPVWHRPEDAVTSDGNGRRRSRANSGRQRSTHRNKPLIDAKREGAPSSGVGRPGRPASS